MRFLYLLLFAVISSHAVFSQSTFPVNGNRNPNNNYIAFTNATITVAPGQVLQKATLLVKNGIIEAVGKDISIPKSSVIYDLKGAFIYHSFIDIYSDYGIQNDSEKNKKSGSPQLESNKEGAYNWNEAVKAENKAFEGFNIEHDKAKELRKNGFGVVATHQQDGIFRGTAALVSLGLESPNESLEQSEVFTSLSFDKGSSKQTYPSSLMGIIALIRQTFYDAQWYENRLGTKEYNITLENVNRTKALPKVISVDSYLSALRADKIAKEFDFRFIIKGNGDEYKRVDEIKALNSAFILPLNFPMAYDVENPYDAMNVSLGEMKHWEMAPFNAAMLKAAEVPFCFTANGLESQSEFLTNWRKAIRAGLSKDAALAAITTSPAQILNLKYTDGTLKKGNPANFIITSASIFDKKSIVYENWVEGQPYIISDRANIDIRGTYSINIEGIMQYDLTVEGELDKLTAKIKSEDSSKPCTIVLKGNQVSLAFASKGSKEVIRLSGHVSDDKSRIWSGNAISTKGDWVKWGAIKKKEFITEKKKDSSEVMTHGPVWYPNMAFGSEIKPVAKNVIYRNAMVWTNESKGILRETDVLVIDGKIHKIGPKLDLSIIFRKKAPEVEEFDAKGMHITSGIIDEHSHIAISRGVNESGQANTAEVSIGDVVNSDDINIYRQLSGGVVASQLLHGSANPIGGQSAIIKLKWGETPEVMKIDSADGFIKFALGENVKQSNWGDERKVRFPQTRMGVEQVYYDDFIRAKTYKDNWTLYNSKNNRDRKEMSIPRKDLELETLVEILDKKRFITCHSYVQSEINMLMHVADSMGFKINTFTHILEGYKVADKMKEHGAAGSTFSDWWAYKFEVNDAIPYNGSILNQMGVTTGFNSDDAEMGRRLNQEAAKAVKYGNVSEVDALKFVTLNPAKMLHLDRRMGSIAEGKDADLVVWSGDPLSVYSKVQKTIIEGVCYYDAERDQELRKKVSTERERLVQKMIEAKKKGEKTKKPEAKEKQLYECESMEDEGYEIN